MAVADPVELVRFVSGVCAEVRDVVGEYGARHASYPEEGSLAHREIFKNGISGPGGPWPPKALDTAFTLAGAIFIGAAGEYLMSLSQVFSTPMALYGFQVLTRSLVEASARAWWLLEPTIDPRERVARAAVERLFSLNEVEKVERAADRGPEEHFERSMNLRVQLAQLGLAEDFDKKGHLIGYEGVRRIESTRLVTAFLTSLGLRNGELVYRTLSGVSHSALYAVLQYKDVELVPGADRAALNSNLPVEAVVNAAVLATSSYLGTVTRHAQIYGRDWEIMERTRIDVTGRLLTSVSTP